MVSDSRGGGERRAPEEEEEKKRRNDEEEEEEEGAWWGVGAEWAELQQMQLCYLLLALLLDVVLAELAEPQTFVLLLCQDLLLFLFLFLPGSALFLLASFLLPDISPAPRLAAVSAAC